MYANGDRRELAAAAFERSLELDRTNTETYVSMGFVFMGVNLMSEAADHFHLALISAHQYHGMEPLPLRELLEQAIFALMAIHTNSRQRVPLFPTDDTYVHYFEDEDHYHRFDAHISNSNLIGISTDQPETVTRVAEFSCGHEQSNYPKVNDS